MPLVPSQLRVAAKCLVAQRGRMLVHVRYRDHDHRWQRNFSQTPPREAAEDPDSILAQLQASPLIKQITDKPEALKALSEFAVILKSIDVNLSPDRPPSMAQVFKLAANPKFREAAKHVAEELRKAGVDINSGNALELFGLKKPPTS
ncbi:hypothetical protein M0805_007449 [Coniferiporia weirii]|nr:hypothetical protein M0805_007449 [Coniferiporia weirii]